MAFIFFFGLSRHANGLYKCGEVQKPRCGNAKNARQQGRSLAFEEFKTGSKWLAVTFPIVPGSIGDRLWVPQTMSKGSSPWRPFPRLYHNQDNSVGQYNMYIRRANVQLAVFMGLLLQIIIGRNRFRRPFPAVPEPLHREFDAAIDSFPLVKPLSTSEIS